MSNYISKEATVLDIKTAKDTRVWLANNFHVDEKNGVFDGSSSNSWDPVLIKTNFDSFFDVLEKEADKATSKICQGTTKDEVLKNIKSTKKKIENSNAFNFLKNSSIWMRLCDNGDWDENDPSSPKPESVNKALKEFEWFKELGLYEFNSAKEFLEYNVRAQQENYIAEIGGHGTHVTPMIYSDETEYRNFFLGIKDGSNISFKFLKKNEEECKDFVTEDVALRILLVDDKIGKPETADHLLVKCKCDACPCNNNGTNNSTEKKDRCKLQVIKKLLSGEFISDKGLRKEFNSKTYWADNVYSYSVDTLRINELWGKTQNGIKLKQGEQEKEREKSKVEQINHDLVTEIKKDSNGQVMPLVQIIGVRDLESALALMSCCKFDIILLDYLLGERTGDPNGRVYSTELFEFLSYDFNNRQHDSDTITMLKQKSGFDDTQLGTIRDEVKLNRGPLGKYWIVPMTSYNSSFITDLQSKHVQLIDHRWNISQGADPINTPWRFLHKLNEFVDLQLRSSVYTMKELLLFLLYTCDDCCNDSDNDNDKIDFFDFQSFMGSEYTSFMRLYGSRMIIKRDAAWQDPNKSTNSTKQRSMCEISVFSTYVWKVFFANPHFRDVIELNRLIQRFLYQASTMHNDRNGQQRLDETFGQLCFFIDTNKKIQIEIIQNKELKDLPSELKKLRKKMDKLTYTQNT